MLVLKFRSSLLRVCCVALLSALAVGCEAPSDSVPADPAEVAPPVAPPPAVNPAAVNPAATGAAALIGNWTIDIESMKASPGFQDATPEQRQQMLAMLAMMEVQFEFTETEIRSTMGMMGQTQESTDTYRVTKVEGSSLTIESTDDQGVVTTVQALLDGDRLQLIDPQAGSFALKRVP